MRAEKQILTKEYVARLNASPFFIVVNYKGLKVAHMTELRKRLQKAGAEIHVVKNSIFRIAAKEAGVGELNGRLAGQLAVVTGQKDISAAAKAVKNFGAEFDKLKVQFGYLDNQRLEQAAILGAGRFAEPGRVARQAAGPVERAGDQTGRFNQHAGDAARARDQGKGGEKLEQFPVRPDRRTGQTNKNNNVNRRFGKTPRRNSRV